MAAASSEALGAPPRGAFVGVVGPSGAGKDSVMSRAQALLRKNVSIVFPQRIVTRSPDAAETNVSMSASDFERIGKGGGFALAWSAHDLSYAVPVKVDSLVAQGRVVVVNVSRSVVPALRQRYARGVVVLIDAPVDLRRARLAQRGREDDLAVTARLKRAVGGFVPADADIVIDNSGPIERSAEALANYLASLTTIQAPAENA